MRLLIALALGVLLPASAEFDTRDYAAAIAAAADRAIAADPNDFHAGAMGKLAAALVTMLKGASAKAALQAWDSVPEAQAAAAE